MRPAPRRARRRHAVPLAAAALAAALAVACTGTFTVYVGDSSALAGLPLRTRLTITSSVR